MILFPCMSRYLAPLALFLLPAVSVELLTGNTSLAIFRDPPTFIIVNITYGGALLLVRETVIRWGQGFASVVVLAAAFGPVTEGIGTKGFFNPHFYAVASNHLEGFGRWFGINVPWAVSISIFHAIFSILVPLVIVSAIFPGLERRRWIGNRIYCALIVAFVAVIALSHQVLSTKIWHYRYDEGPGPIALVAAFIALDILIAWKLPASRSRRWQLQPPALTLFVAGAVYVFAYVFSTPILHATGQPVAFVAVDLGFFVVLPVWLLCKLPEPSSRGKVALAAGLLVPLLTIARGRGPGSLFAAIIVTAMIIIALIRSRSPNRI